MPAFSEDQINEAKERVRRMHARAGAYLPKEPKPDRETQQPKQVSSGREKQAAEQAEATDTVANDNAVVLILILLLSQEGADQALLLALLYLLF